MTVRRFRLGVPALLPALALAATSALPAAAAELPIDARIVYDVLYGGNHFRVGRAEQRWRIADGHYELTTEVNPIIGPRIRYVSKGRMGPNGLVPESFGEFRGSEARPRVRAEFDWTAQKLLFGRSDENKTATLEPGAQDVNALAYQLAWLGDKSTGTFQVTTGKNVAKHSFSAGPHLNVQIGSQHADAVPLRSGTGTDRTEVWLAPRLGNLPVRVVRIDDDKELQFVAREVQVDASGH
jgi:hypothetical protein